MKKLIIASIFFCYNSSFAQDFPALSVPYIPVRPADLDAARADIINQNRIRYEEFVSSVDDVFVESVQNVNMLPCDKKLLRREFSRIRKSQDSIVDTNPYIIYKERSTIPTFTDEFNAFALNNSTIQQYKTKYTRVLAWESYLRDKELLDKPYSNAKGPTGLTNRQALGILYGTDLNAFINLNWE